MKTSLRLLLLLLLCLPAIPASAQITCSPSGNLWVYTNYDGGILNINVDVNIPNIKIGICTYEPVTINISGAFAANVTEVRYAGYVSTNHNHCGNSPATTTITGVPANITSVNFLPGATLSNPNGYSSIVCAYTCVTTSNQGGCNTADQIKDYFQTSMNAVLTSYWTDYNCFPSAPFTLSSGGNCCNSVQPCTITADAGSPLTICPNGSVTLTGSGTGPISSYSWSPSTGLSNPNIASPTASPTQTTTYTLTASDGALCADTDTVTVTVANPQASISPLPSVCAGAQALALTGGSPAGGTWSGPGVSNGMFDPILAGPGTHSLSYTVVDANNCSAVATASMQVFPSPLVTLQADGPFCLNDPALAMSTGTPAGGSYSGSGIVNGQFFPTVAGVGSHPVQYSFTDANGCTATASQVFVVNAIPTTPTVSLGGTDSLYASTPGDSFVWSLNGLPWLTNGPIVQAPQSGNYTVVVWSNGCPSAPSAAFPLELQSIEIGGLMLEVWPNPAANRLNLRAPGAQFSAFVFDMQGRMVLPATEIDGIGSLDLQRLPAGTYLLKVEGDSGIGSLRIVKQD